MKTIFTLSLAAIVLFSAMQSLAQDAGVSLFDKGVKLADAKKFKEAAEVFLQAVQKDPTDSVSFKYLSYCQLELAQYDKAVESARKAVSLDSSEYVAYNNLGWGLVMLGQVDDGIAELRTAIKINPSYALAHNNLGYALLKQGRDDEALTELKTATALDSNDKRPHINLGELYVRKGKYHEAAAEYEKLARVYPGEEARCRYAVLLNEMGQREKAQSLFRAIVEAVKSSPSYVRRRQREWLKIAQQNLN